MATGRQIEANRVNSRRSTGPRTAAGKARSRANAVKHGLLARQVTVAPGDGRAFGRFRARSLRQLAPVGPLEEFLADRVITQSWRLRRVLVIESRITDWDAAARQQPAPDPTDELNERRLLAFLERHRREQREGARGQAAVGQAPNGGEAHERALYEGATGGPSPVTPAWNPSLRDGVARPTDERAPDDRAMYERAMDEPPAASRAARVREDPEDCGEPAGGAAIRQTLAGPNSAFDVLRRYERGIERGLYAAMRELERMQEKRRDQGLGTRDQGLGTRDQGLGTRG